MSNHIEDHPFLFHGLNPEQTQQVRSIFHPVFEPDGSLLFNQGDPADYLYLVLEGEVIIEYKPEDGPSIVVARVRSEGVVGWSSALGSPKYTSSAVCSRECQMLRVLGKDLRTLCENHPETGALVLERLAVVVAERIRNTHDQVRTLLGQGLHIERVE